MDEPEGGVGDRVVGRLEGALRDIENVHDAGAVGRAVQVQPPACRGTDRCPVPAAERCAHPQHIRLCGYCGGPGHQAAAAAPGGQLPVIAERE